MQVAVLGTGAVGKALGNRLLDLGHGVALGSRSADNENGRLWLMEAIENGADAASLGTFRQAAEGADLIINATAGVGSIEALESVGADLLAGKVLLDVSNALDFSQGFPPRLAVANDDSLGEQIQRAFPDALVVKSLHTVNNAVMVHPEIVPGPHTMFVSGNDDEAKNIVKGLLTEFGWPAEQIIDLGDITGARATEMYLPLWIRLMGKVGSADFNINVAQ